MRLDRLVQEGIMLGERRSHGGRMLEPKPGAALKIGEEEGYCSSWRVVHQKPRQTDRCHRNRFLRPSTASLLAVVAGTCAGIAPPCVASEAQPSVEQQGG